MSECGDCQNIGSVSVSVNGAVGRYRDYKQAEGALMYDDETRGMSLGVCVGCPHAWVRDDEHFACRRWKEYRDRTTGGMRGMAYSRMTTAIEVKHGGVQMDYYERDRGAPGTCPRRANHETVVRLREL